MDVVSLLDEDLRKANEENKEEFFCDLENGNLNYFLGAGISSINEWATAIENICKNANLAFNRDKISPQDLKDTANDFMSKDTKKFVKEEFNKFSEKIKQVYLPILNSKFEFLLTTNFDNEIPNIIYTGMKASEFNIEYYPVLWRVLTSEKQDSKKIIHIHGLLSDGCTDIEDIVLSSKSFETAYNKTALKSILLYLFTNYTFFFYGFNIGEKEIKLIIDEALDIVHRNAALFKKYIHSANKPKPIKLYKLEQFNFNQAEIEKEANEIKTTVKDLVNRKIKEVMKSFHKTSYFKILIYNQWSDFDLEFVQKNIEINKRKEEYKKQSNNLKNVTMTQNPSGPEVDL